MTKIESIQVPHVDFARLAHDIQAMEKEHSDSELLEVLKGSKDLSVYEESVKKDLRSLEEVLLQEVISDSSSLLRLYTETQECERIVGEMESTLTGFADSLRGVSDEIRQLQDKSEELSNQLKSRSEVQEKLIAFVDAAVISPDIVKTICEEEDCCSDRFIAAITQLGKRLSANALLDPTLPAVTESAGDFHKLKLKAVGRIRDYIVSSLSALKQAKSANILQIQQSTLIKAAPLMRFLKELDSGEFFIEIVGYYSSVVSKYYLNFFKAYVQGLSKIPLEAIATKTDLVGSVEDKPPRGSVFSLAGGRDRVIKEELNSEPLSEGSVVKCYPESILRSHQKLLIETATNEFIFLKQFLSEPIVFDQVCYSVDSQFYFFV